MPDVQHNTLTGAELHEPKGIDAAGSGEIYVADGAGSGAWQDPAVNPADGSAGEVPVANGSGAVVWSPRFYIITEELSNISSAGEKYIPIPYGGNVVKVVGCLGGTITGSDATITVKDSAGNSMGAITVAQAGSAAGDVDSLVPASNQDVTDDDWIEIETDGASTNAVRWVFNIVIERDA